jgi:hypothetical protein
VAEITVSFRKVKKKAEKAEKQGFLIPYSRASGAV